MTTYLDTGSLAHSVDILSTQDFKAIVETLNLACINVKLLRDLSKCSRLFDELSNFFVGIGAVQETHFICVADGRVLKNDFVVHSAFGDRSCAVVFLLVGRSLNADVNLVFADDGGRLVIADVAVKSLASRVDALYVSAGERRSFFRRLEPFFDDVKWIVLMGD